jgi:hypothetical protein
MIDWQVFMYERLEVAKELYYQGKLIVMDTIHLAVRIYEFGLLLLSFVYSLEPLVDECESWLDNLRRKLKR